MNRREFLTSTVVVPALACAAPARAPSLGNPALTRLGASTACLAGLSLLDAIAQLQRLGFGTIEMISYTGASHSIGEIPGFAFADSLPGERERVFEATRSFSHISTHLPFHDVFLFSSTPEDREVGLRRLRDALDGLAYLQGELAVLHIGSPGKGRSYRDIWQPMIEMLRMLGDYAAERHLRIGIETMQPDAVHDYVELIGETDHPAVGATIDTGHIRGSADIGLPRERRNTAEARARFNDVLNTLVATLQEKVVHVHLSDVEPIDWVDHKTVGSGIIDFDRLFETIRRIDYRHLFVFELEEPDQLEALHRSTAHVQRAGGAVFASAGLWSDLHAP
jgi:sugar phosphate isomerase/epimerase